MYVSGKGHVKVPLIRLADAGSVAEVRLGAHDVRWTATFERDRAGPLRACAASDTNG